MKRLVFIISIIMACLPFGLYAQKKDIAQARAYVKTGKDLDKAERLMTQLLADSANRDNEKIWITLMDALRVQYDQGNEKLYLKQVYDTAALFNVTDRLFHVAWQFDSIDAQPDKNGRVRLKCRERHSERLNRIRPNLYNGGAYFSRRQDFKRSLRLYEDYLMCAWQPLFSEYDYLKTDSLLPMAAYGAVYAAYQLQKDSVTLFYAPLALRDTTHLNFTLQYLAETYRSQGDTLNYLGMLRRGFDQCPTSVFFFSRLVDFYNQTERPDSAMAIVNRSLAIDSLSQLFRFTKSTVLLNTGRYEECIAICDSLISENDSLADAYYNLGLAYFNQAIELDKVNQPTKLKQRRIKELYQKSLPYMERYRGLAPDQHRKWLSVLYTLYLNLNMGEEFDEIDRLRMRYSNR